jgi:hypothetical protein
MDTSRAESTTGDISNEQLEWLKKDLAGNAGKFTIVFSHHPLLAPPPFDTGPPWDEYITTQGASAREILGGSRDVHLAISGHLHVNKIQQERDIWYVSTGSLDVYPCCYRIFRVSSESITVETYQITYPALVKKAKQQLDSSTLAFKYNEARPQAFAELAFGSRLDNSAILPLVAGQPARPIDEKRLKQAEKERKKNEQTEAPAKEEKKPKAEKKKKQKEEKVKEDKQEDHKKKKESPVDSDKVPAADADKVPAVNPDKEPSVNPGKAPAVDPDKTRAADPDKAPTTESENPTDTKTTKAEKPSKKSKSKNADSEKKTSKDEIPDNGASTGEKPAVKSSDAEKVDTPTDALKDEKSSVKNDGMENVDTPARAPQNEKPAAKSGGTKKVDTPVQTE